MVFVLSAFYPFENKNEIISFFFFFKEETNWTENIKETYLEFTTTVSIALPLRVLNEQSA